MLKKKTTDIHLPTAKDMARALADFRSIQLKHDARLMFLICLDRAGHFGRQLKALGMETDESMDPLFKAAFEQAKRIIKAPTQFDPTAKPTGKPS